MRSRGCSGGCCVPRGERRPGGGGRPALPRHPATGTALLGRFFGAVVPLGGMAGTRPAISRAGCRLWTGRVDRGHVRHAGRAVCLGSRGGLPPAGPARTHRRSSPAPVPFTALCVGPGRRHRVRLLFRHLHLLLLLLPPIRLRPRHLRQPVVEHAAWWLVLQDAALDWPGKNLLWQPR